jgi:hypothetical protein
MTSAMSMAFQASSPVRVAWYGLVASIDDGLSCCVRYYASALGFLTWNSNIWLRSIVPWLWLSSLNESEKSGRP